VGEREEEIAARLTAALREVGDEGHGDAFAAHAPEDVTYLLARVAELERVASGLDQLYRASEALLLAEQAKVAELEAERDGLRARVLGAVSQLSIRADACAVTADSDDEGPVERAYLRAAEIVRGCL
jgi:hypothetical protein